MSDFDKYLKGEPLNDRLAALMEGEDPDEDQAVTEESSVRVAVIGEIGDDERDHLRRLLVEPGWPVLLKLLDTDLARREDAAKHNSLANPLDSGLNAQWIEVAYSKKARDKIVALAEFEVEKLRERERKKKWQGAGTTKTQTEIS